MAQIDNLPPLRDVIRTHDLIAKKSLGQNFLLDLNLTAKIARLAGDLTGSDVLEIGPGPGGLTRGLLAEGARRVLAIEKDSRCLAALAEIEAHYRDRFKVINADALDLDPLEHLTPPIRVVSNLPYNVGTELLIRWLTPNTWPPFWESLTLMFQREVAERIVAAPGSKAYGKALFHGRNQCLPARDELRIVAFLHHFDRLVGGGCAVIAGCVHKISPPLLLFRLHRRPDTRRRGRHGQVVVADRIRNGINQRRR